MSGFDDLLKQSSRALEENPFEDPFAPARSNSPDPWSSYTHQTAAPTSSGFEYGESGFSGQSPTTPTVESHDESSAVPPVAVESHSSSVPAALFDPLDSANLPADDKPDSATKLSTSPVFFEARHTAENDPLPDTPESPVQQTFPSEAVVSDVLPPAAPSLTLPPATSPPETSPTVQLSSPESPPSATPAELPDNSSPQSPPPPSSARLPQRQYVPQPSIHIPFTPSSPTVSESNRVISTPLDQPPTTSFASLALGGESFNGWDGAQSTFVNNASLPSVAPQEDDDDDDDDKPLRPRPVSPSSYCLSGVQLMLVVAPASNNARQEGNWPATSVHDYSRGPSKGWRPHPSLHDVHGAHQGMTGPNSVTYRLSSSRFLDDFPNVLPTVIFCSSPLFRLPMAV
jgi:sorting nexin-1/2